MSWAEGRSEERDIKLMPCNAGAAISPNRILQKDGTDPLEVIQATAGSQYPAGISGDASENGAETYAENDPIAMIYEGVAYIKMSGSGNQDDRVMATTDGKGIRHTTSSEVYITGHAMKDWVDGDLIPVNIQRYYIGDFSLS